MPVLKYKDGAGYTALPGGIEEVTISATQPPIPTDLWLDTSDNTSYPDNILSGFRNVVRNGDMSIRQRGNGTFTGTNQAFFPTLDGWRTTHNGGTVTTDWYSAGTGLAGGVSDAGGVIGVASSGGTGTGHYLHLSQTIESVLTFAGKLVTVSFIGYVTSGSAKVGIQVRQTFGTGGSPSAQTEQNLGTITLTTTPTRFSVTGTVPSISGKTFGTNNNHALQLVFWLSAGTDNSAAAGGIPIQNATFVFTDVQMEAGTIATPFERLPFQQQLAWCQRYFHRLGPLNPMLVVPGSNYSIGTGPVGTTVNSYVFHKHPVTMRAAPSMAASAFNTLEVTNSAAGAVPTAFSLQGSASDVAFLTISHAAAFATGQIVYLRTTSPSAYVDFSAEL